MGPDTPSEAARHIQDPLMGIYTYFFIEKYFNHLKHVHLLIIRDGIFTKVRIIIVFIYMAFRAANQKKNFNILHQLGPLTHVFTQLGTPKDPCRKKSCCREVFSKLEVKSP